ncbi:MAG: tetratricopeptide repeat protein [Gammaproteobacteria bacterium]|jgi:predicted TPR repeat methyltransferase|nr:tetratricopeptide repeat protein [Gammaproteobacteria bacterium]
MISLCIVAYTDFERKNILYKQHSLTPNPLAGVVLLENNLNISKIMTKNNDIEIQKKIEQAYALSNDNQHEASIELFKEVISQSPNAAYAIHGLGMAYAQLRDFPKAVQYLQQAVKTDPSIAEFHNNLGNAYQAVGQINDAMTHYREALRLKASYAQAHNNLGTLLYRLGKYEDAASHFQKSLRIDPLAVDTHYNLANCYIQLDRLLDAVPHYQAVIKERPSHLGALHNLGITLCGLKRFDEALPLLEEVRKREPHNVDALFHLGVIYGALNKLEDAIQCYLQVLSQKPDHGNSHHNLATIYLHQNKRDQALTHYQEALRIEPNNKTAAHLIDALKGKTLIEGAPVEYTRALFDQYAYSYDSHVKNHLHYLVPQLLRQAIAPFVNQSQEPWKILDIGCGTGLCAPLFADIAGKLIGVDISENMIEVARAHGGYYKLYVMDILTFLERGANEFDVVIAADVFVYFGGLEKVFAGCHRVLKSNGLFTFSIELLMDLESKADPEHPDFQLRKTGRYAHHPEYIERLTTTLGYKIEFQKSENIRYQDDEPVVGNVYVLRKL